MATVPLLPLMLFTFAPLSTSMYLSPLSPSFVWSSMQKLPEDCLINKFLQTVPYANFNFKNDVAVTATVYIFCTSRVWMFLTVFAVKQLTSILDFLSSCRGSPCLLYTSRCV